MIRNSIIFILFFLLTACGGGGDSQFNNELPVADAGEYQVVDEQTEVELSGIGTDLDGSVVSYNWVQIAGTRVILNDANTPVATFVSPGVVLEETLLFQLTIIDNKGGKDTDKVEVMVVFTEDNDFNYSQELFGISQTLFIGAIDQDDNTGIVSVNGVDTGPVSKAFILDWGDGTSPEDQWFPFSHTYGDTGRNYKITVTSTYSDGTSNTQKALVQFTTFDIDSVQLPDELQVRIPSEEVVLESHWYSAPTDLTTFDDSFFILTPRNVLEYILTVAATIQMEAVNDNVFLVDGSFRQVVLRDADFGGAYSLWYTSPVSFAAGDYIFQNNIDYSSLLHEMGHNFSLNSPAEFHYGGRIDGSANAIYSESMARIFQYSTGYQIMNNLKTYNIHEDLALVMENSFRTSVHNLRVDYENYISEGSPYSSWNDPITQIDETFGTFSAISYKFMLHAEQSNKGYILPLRRMMCLLQQFDVVMHEAYNQSENTLEADAFRATLMVTALSYAFDEDLRQEFTDLNFPMDNNYYAELISGVPPTCAY